MTKIWKGSGEHPLGLTVQLYADGVRVSSAYLTAQNGWQYTFDMPKYDDARKEIKYTVTEENLSGYTASRADEENNGYKNVFVNTKEKPNNPGGGGNTPNNPGGGGNTPNPPTPPSENPGEVLAANRTPEGNVLGAERPTVLGVGRGYTKTEDSRNIWMNLALFAVAGLGFCTSLFVGRKKRNSR